MEASASASSSGSRLKAAARALLGKNERFLTHPAVSRAFSGAQQSPSNGEKSEEDVLRLQLQALAACLVEEELLVDVVRCMRPFMTELTARMLDPATALYERAPDGSFVEIVDHFKRHEAIAAALASLLQLVPTLWSIAQNYLDAAPCFFEFVGVQDARSGDALDRVRRIAATAHRLLRMYPHDLPQQWNWSAFFPLCFHNDVRVRWFAARATAVVLRLGAAQRVAFLQKLGVSERDAVKEGPIRQLEIEQHLYDVNVDEQRIELSVCQVEADENLDVDAQNQSAPVPLHASLKNIFGVIIPASSRAQQSSDAEDESAERDALVPTASTAQNLQAIAIALGLKRPVLVSGPGGSGKTAVIRELARLSGNSDLVELHLDDQIDSKTLLGSYVCTEVPGEFTWQPGALTTAILSGRWVVIEDIDRAPFEVLAALMPLLETREMVLPGRGERLVAHPNFQIFGTTSHRHSMPKGFQESIWTAIDLRPMEASETQQVVQTRFNRIPTPVVQKIMTTFNVVCCKEVVEDALVANMAHVWKEARRNYGRDFCLRDLLKWGKRICAFCYSGSRTQDGSSDYITEDERLRILMEAFDIFCAGIRDAETRLQAAIAIGTIWEVQPDKIRFCLEQYKPHVSFSAHEVEIGRVHLPTLPSHEQTDGYVASSSVVMTGHVLRLLERLAAIAYTREPALLIGETGCGKTTIIQHLARSMGQQLVVQNLNIQSDSADLVGGFKPVEIHLLARPVYMGFVELFTVTFSQKSNASFLNIIRTAFERKEWKKMVKGMRKALQMAASKLSGSSSREEESKSSKSTAVGGTSSVLSKRWDVFESELERFERQKEQAESHFAFSFVEGVLVKALREGHWVLLDEINLASSDTLERISTLLEHETSAFSLTERGDVEIIRPHPNFRIFGAMNPSTDVGKKDLPPSLRNRFTEIYVDECVSPTDLQMVVQHQFKEIHGAPVAETVKFYLEARKLAEERLSDGARHKPRYSLRTLTRALLITRILIQRGYGLPRALYEGFGSSFCTQLEIDSRQYMERLIKSTFAKSMKAKELNRAPPRPGRSRGADEFVLVSSYWVTKGDFMEPRDDSLPDPVTSRRKFVLTKSVEENLRHVSRAALIGRYPVLLQGPTSAGKTSLISYMAARIGQKCVRINNHEHTDIQEYLGSYVSDSDGKLSFKEGVLVEAVRNGWWIILDELNLAPSEVLEALNRLLDDNRELFLPETQETVKPHPKFMLFATQNPPGLYGGRKVLSRAFRNRFLEVQVDEVATKELQTILQERSSLPPSYCSILIDIMRQLQLVRQQSSIFAGKAGFITTRDLLRWAERRPMSKQALAEEGYCLLAERLRKEDEKALVKQVIEEKCNVTIDLDAMYYTGKARESNVINENGETEVETAWGTNEQFERVQELIESALGAAGGEKIEGNAAGLDKISVTKSLRRLFALVGRCLQHEEPVLLVGETGCGKTTVCQLYSLLFNQPLHIINCHQHTETSDFLGCLRPVRGKEKIERELREAVVKYLSAIADIDVDSTQPLSSLLDSYEGAKKNGSAARMNDGDDDSLEQLALVIDDLRRRLQSIFEWADGPLVDSMKSGDLILIDEVNLAEDAVLERLNSVLEPSRTLLLAEKGGDSVEEIVAHPKWRVMATMNPGGDFGKRELSPALRNRFTEIWVPAISDLGDIATIIHDRLVKHSVRGMVVESPETEDLARLCDPILSFVKTFNESNSGVGGCGIVTLRDILSWINFITSVARSPSTGSTIGPWTLFVQGAALAILDGLGLGSDKALQTALKARDDAYTNLLSLIPDDEADAKSDVIKSLDPTSEVIEGHNIHDLRGGSNADLFGIGPFAIPQGNVAVQKKSSFSVKAPTTMANLYRVLRAMQVSRPIILEGSPGVGKTSLISALAAASGHRLVRINLSEQTDISDLFGSDLPATSGTDVDNSSGMFEWCDGVFLRALKAGDWVLLDELNLASQSVLEGLNSCLDHRGTVYIPELDREFECPPTFRVFAAQNPLRQGGGRKGLPKSFLNRFTRVFVDALHDQDLIHIASSVYPSLHSVEIVSRDPTKQFSLLERMIAFNNAVHHDTMVACRYGRMGSPWEFNLRDVFRFCELLGQHSHTAALNTSEQLHAMSYYVNFIYVKRMRTTRDRELISQRFLEFFGVMPVALTQATLKISPDHVQVGSAFVERKKALSVNRVVPPVFDFLLDPLEALAHCVNMAWPALLVGPPASGKTSSVRLLAALTGNVLHELGMSAGTDATELLGCFEQVDVGRKLRDVKSKVQPLVENAMRKLMLDAASSQASSNTKIADKAMKTAKLLCTTWWALVKRENYAHESGSQQSKSEVDSVAVDLMRDVLRTIKRILATEGIEKLECEIDAVVAISKSHSIASRFEWVDGTLIHAMENGEWILLDNVNFCSSSVLDRLNSLMETGGDLLINECGVINGQLRVVKPHPNFRLFLAMDSQFGEVSRAMRNRCIEIALIGDETRKMDAVRMSAAARIPGRELGLAFQAVHSRVLEKLRTTMAIASRINRRHLENWSQLAAAEMSRGVPTLEAIGNAFQRIYGTHVLSELELQDEALHMFEVAIRHSQESAFKQRVLSNQLSVFQLCQSPSEAELVRDMTYVEYLVGILFVTPSQEEIGTDILLDSLGERADQSGLLIAKEWHKLLSLRMDQSKSLAFIDIVKEARSHLISTLKYDDKDADSHTTGMVAPFALRSATHSLLAAGSTIGISEERLLLALDKFSERVKASDTMHSSVMLLRRFLKSIVQSDMYQSITSQLQANLGRLETLIPGSRMTGLPVYLFANFAEFTRLKDAVAAERARDASKAADLDQVWGSIVNSQDRLDLLDGFEWLRFQEIEEYHAVDTMVTERKKSKRSAESQISLSVLQQSYGIHTHHFDRTDVENEILVLVYPFLDACDGFMRAFMKVQDSAIPVSIMNSAKTMMRDRFEFSLQLRGTTLDWMRFLIHWQWVRKALLRLDGELKNAGQFQSLQTEWITVIDMVDRIHESVSKAIGGVLGKSVLWKNGGHALLPRSSELWEAHALLEKLSATYMQVSRVLPTPNAGFENAQVDVLALLFGGVASMEAAMKIGKLDISSLFFVDEAARKEVLHALCAFSYLTQEQMKSKAKSPDDKNPMTIAEELFKLPDVLLNKLKEQQEETTSIIAKQALYLSEIEDNGQSFVEFLSEEDSRIGKDAPILLFDMKESAQLVEQLVHFQLSPLLEHALARQEVAAIGQMTRLVNMFDLRQSVLSAHQFVQEIASLLSQLRELVAGFLRVPLRDPSSYYAYQDLIWRGHKFTDDNSASVDMTVELVEFMSLVKTHLNSVLFGFHRSLRVNSFNQIDQIAMEIFDTQRKLRKKSNQRPKTITKDEEDHSFVAAGYPRLFQAVESAMIMKCVAEVDLEDSSCATVETQVRSVRLKKLKQYLANNVHNSANRVQTSTESYVKELFVATVVPFASTFSEEVWTDIVAVLLQVEDNLATKDTKRTLETLLKSTSDPVLADTVSDFVPPIVGVLTGDNVSGDIYRGYGEALLLVGLWRFVLVLPQSPVDPVTKPLVKKEILYNRLAVMTMEDAVDVALKRVAPPAARSPEWVGCRDDAIVETSKQIANVAANAIQRFHLSTDSSSTKAVQPVAMSVFGDLFRDLRRFQCTIMPNSKMLAFLSVSRSKSCSIPKTRDILRELNLFQQASDNFVEQLTKKYANAFRDVIEPVVAAISAVKEGIALITWSLFRVIQEQSVSEAQKHDLALALVQFPSAPVPLKLLSQHGASATWRSIQLMLSTIGSSAASVVFGGSRYKRKSEIALLNVALARLQLYFRAELSEASTAVLINGNSSVENAFVCVKALFDLFLEKWQEQKEKEEQRRKEEEELFKYKVRNTEFETEEQIEEQEFREQFPDYHTSDFSAFLTAEQVALNPAGENALNAGDVMITDKMMQQLCVAHAKLFAATANSNVRVASSEIVQAFAKAFTLGASMHKSINTLASPLIESASVSSGHLAVSIVQNAIGYQNSAEVPSIQSLSSEYVGDIDFHRDPFVKEAVLVNEPLQRLLVKLQSLLALWPDHAILQQLVLIADRIRNFEISSPLARTLTGVELLLRKAQEWEAYAARNYSISTELGALSTLVTRWRKLELYSWPHLLRVKEKQHQASAQKSWLNLYSLLTGEFEHDMLAGRRDVSNGQRFMLLQDQTSQLSTDLKWLHLNDLSKWLFKANESLDSNDQEASKKRQEWIKQLFSTLDEYLRSCPLGQYETRLLILYSFCAQFFMEFWNAPQDSPSCSQSRYVLATMLFQLYRFYAQHLGFLGRQWSGLKEPIQRKLLEFVKIARWDEQTYYSLAESAEKSHRKLMKFVRDYDTVLTASMQTVIDSSTDSSISKEGGFAGIHSTLNELSGLNDAVIAVYEPKKENEDASEAPEGDDANSQLEKHAKKANLKGEESVNEPKPPVVLIRSVPVAKNFVVDELLETKSQYVEKLPSLSKRIAKFTRTRIISPDQVELRQAPRQLCEEICESIFYRMDMLQKAKNLPKGSKKKALIDLLAEMKDQGLSYHRMHLPAEMQDMERLFELDVPDVENCIQLDHLEELVPGVQTASNKSKKRKGRKGKSMQEVNPLDLERPMDSLLWLWERADGYYYRFLGQIGALRFSALSSFSHNLSMSEVDRMSGYAENMLFTMLQQRQVLHAASLHHEKLVDALTSFERLKKFRKSYSSSNVKLNLARDWQSNQLTAVTALRGPLRDMEALVYSVTKSFSSDQESIASRSRIQTQMRAITQRFESVSSSLSSDTIGLRRSLGAPSVPTRFAQPVGGQSEPGDAGLMAFALPSQRVYGVSPIVANSTPANLSNMMTLVEIDTLAANSVHFNEINALLTSIIAEFSAQGRPSSGFDGIAATCAEIVESDAAMRSTCRQSESDSVVMTDDSGAELCRVGFVENFDKLIETVLVSIQDLTKVSTREDEKMDESERSERSLRDQLGELNATIKHSRLNQVATQLVSVLDIVASQYSQLVSSGSADWHRAFEQSMSMLEIFETSLHDVRDISRQLLVDFLVAHKSVTKMDFVLIRIFRNLFQHGFCRTEDKEQDGESGGDGKMQFTDDVDGTGMGEGEGKKDVSNEIEDEEQLLGLKGEEQQQQEQNDEKPDDTGLEMQNDFEGTMQDVPDDEKDENDDKDDEEEELDREMGEFNQDDENVVDEKMWGEDSDDDEDKIDKEKEKFEEDSKVENSEPIEDEIRGKDGDEDEDKKKDDSKKEDDKQPSTQPEPAKDDAGGDADDESGGDDDNDPDDEKQDDVNDDFDDKYEENHEIDPQNREEGQEEEAAADDENADLPDDMQLDNDDKPDGDGQDGDDGMNDEPDADEQLDGDEEIDGDHEKDEDMAEDEEKEEEPADSAVPMGGGGLEDEPEAADEDPEEDNADPANDESAEDENSAASNAVAGTQSKDGKDELEPDDADKEEDEAMYGADDRNDARDQDESASNRAQQHSNDNADDSQDWRRQSEVAPASGENSTPPQEKRRERSEPNPYRNPVSAQEHWRKRVEMVETPDDGESKEPKEKNESAEMAAAEYVDDDDEDMDDVEHALAPADDNQVMNQPGNDDEKEEDDAKDDEDASGATAMEVDDDADKDDTQPDGEQNKQTTDQEREDRVKREHKANEPRPDDQDPSIETSDEVKDETMGDDEAAELRFDEDDEESELPSRIRELELTSKPTEAQETELEDAEAQDAHLLTPEEVAGLRDELDTFIAQWSQNGDAAQRGAELWSKYTALTAPASQRLCEQLRLVLEPMLRAKLEGDFRTGKRINMRKVIPYIASQFRKDKIWMRRTRPSKRQYQIMVAIDDSESMADNHAGRLALEAMATLCRGMTQLEVGELAVAKFGERLELLHSFDTPFTDDSGGRVISQFGFQQKKTHMVQTLDALLQVLETAKLSSSGNSTVEFTQIVFLISDGRFDSDGRVRIRKLIETALERQQLIVLLVVDQAAAKGDGTSILETKSVSFVGGKVEMTPYLENYPFPYYVLLPASALLPEILADSLRQWFEMLQMKS